MRPKRFGRVFFCSEILYDDSKLRVNMFCKECGANNTDEAVFCLKCGKRLEDEEETKVALRGRPDTEGAEAVIFSITPTLFFVKLGYAAAVVGAFVLVALMSIFFPCGSVCCFDNSGARSVADTGVLSSAETYGQIYADRRNVSARSRFYFPHDPKSAASPSSGRHGFGFDISTAFRHW